MAKECDVQKLRCKDCIYLKKVKVKDPEYRYTNNWVCMARNNIEIHHVTDDECLVLSENYG